MKAKNSEEFDRFDKVMDGLLAVPYSELQQKREQVKRSKEKKKKRPTSTASSPVSASGKGRGT